MIQDITDRKLAEQELRTALDELAIAKELRRLSVTANPNPRIVSIADRMLGRSGRMVEAIEKIGRGAEAREGEPYELPLQWPLG